MSNLGKRSAGTSGSLGLLGGQWVLQGVEILVTRPVMSPDHFPKVKGVRSLSLSLFDDLGGHLAAFAIDSWEPSTLNRL